MDDIKEAIDALKELSRNKRGLNIEEHISNLTSTMGLLELHSPSIDQYKTLYISLRERLQPLYLAQLRPTLNYAMAVLRFLNNEKIVPFLRSDPGRANLWESPTSSVVSGILDYLEKHQTKKARETVASAVYPTICAFYFSNGPSLLSSYDGNVLSNVYMLLGETVESPGGDASKLRDDHIGGRRLGHTIAEIRNYLALESIINLLGNLIPPLKGGKEKRTKFLQEVFEETLFKDCKRILQALEIIKRDWTVTATKIIHILAESDSRFPQPFQVFRFQIESSPMATSDPIFVDNKSFVASLDQGGSVDSLMIPFTTVAGVSLSALNGSEMKVELLINKAPLLGNNPMSLPQRGTYSVSFSIVKLSVNNFGKAMRERNLRLERPAQRKLSLAPSELLPEIMTTEDDKKWQAKAAKLTNMAKHGDSDPVDLDKFTSSPQPGDSISSNLDEHQDRGRFVNVPSDELPSTVFLDPNGNFSFHPPRPTVSGHALPVTAPEKLLSRKASEDEEISLRHKRNFKSKTIIISDDEDERPSSTEAGAPKQKTAKTGKKSDAAQLPKVPKTDAIASRQTQKPATDIVDDNSRKPIAKTSNDAKKSNVAKKRVLQDDPSDVEAPAAKRVRQDSDSVAPSPVAPPKRQTKYGRKSQNVTPKDNGFDIDFDEIPKPKQDRPQSRAKAMKGRGGKVGPRARPVATKKNKKQGESRETVQRKANVEVEDADKTLVEKTKQLESHEIKAKGGRSAKDMSPQAASRIKSVNTRSKKSNTAPWEMQDFTSVKLETTEDPTVGFDPIDHLPSTVEQPSSDVADETENHDVPLHSEGIFGDRYIDFVEPVKSETTSPSEPPPSRPAAQSGQVWIDLTNSPEPVEVPKPTPSLKRAIHKTPSFDRQRHDIVEEVEVPSVHRDQALHTMRINPYVVRKIPLPPMPSDELESISSTPHRSRARSTKFRKLTSPIRVHRLPLGGGKHKTVYKTTQAIGRHMEEEEIRPRPIPKQPKDGTSGPSRRPRGSEVEDDPDSKIAAVLGEINKVLVGNIQNRFTGMSSGLQHTKRELKAQVAGELGKMNHELFKRYNNLVELQEGYVSHTTKLSNVLEGFEKASADSVQSYRDMLKDFKRNSLLNKLPKDLVKDSTIAEIMKFSKLNISI